MTPDEITLVQQSFEKVKPISEQAAHLFYGRLFELDPALRPLFKGDMKEQGRKLMQMLALAVNGLTKIDTIAPAVAQLGQRHEGYGVSKEMYATVASALLWTLEQGLGKDFTPPVKDAWVAAYTLLAGVMTAPRAAA